jgi:DNA gyrase subunit B
MRPRRSSRHVSNSLDAVLAHLGRPSVDAHEVIRTKWATIVGSRLAGWCWPSELVSGELVVSTTDPVVAEELNLISRELAGQVLEGLEAVRKRPGMYIGSTGLGRSAPPGLGGRRQLGRRGDGRLLPRGSTSPCWPTAAAGGRQRPRHPGHRTHPKFKGKSAAEVVLTVLHAGGKFGGEGYKVSGGLHGVGVSVVNALSERLRSRSTRGQRYQQEYAKGGKPQGKLAVRWAHAGARSHGSGTTVTFWPDPTDLRRRGHRVRQPHRARALADHGVPQQGLRSSSVTSARASSKTSPFQYKGGIVDFVKHLNASKEALFSKVGTTRSEDRGGQTLEVAIQWNTGYNDGIHSFANGISTIEGGMHEEGFKKALTNVSTSTRAPRVLLKEKDDNLSARTSARASPPSSR